MGMAGQIFSGGSLWLLQTKHKATPHSEIIVSQTMIWPNSSLPPIEGALTSPFPPLPQLSFSCSSATFILHQLLCSDPPLQTNSIISHPKKKINFCSAREMNSMRKCSQEQESGKGGRLPLFFKKLLHQFSCMWKKKIWSPIFTLLTEWRIHRSEYVDYLLVYPVFVFPKVSSRKNF